MSFNFKQDILEATAGEIIEAVVILDLIKPYAWSYTRDIRDTDSLKATLTTPLSWEQAAPLLDYYYDTGFGARDCHLVVIYTDQAIHYIHEYDGSTELRCVLKDPSKYKRGEY